MGESNIKWESDNAKVASVNGGTVSAVAATASVDAYGDILTASCDVTVEKHQEITIELSETKFTMLVGKTHKLAATVTGISGISDSDITWESDIAPPIKS